MELVENDILRVESVLNRVLESCCSDTKLLAEFCTCGKSFREEDVEYVGQFGEIEFTDRIRGNYQEYQVLQADGKLWIFWGDDPEVASNVWLLPIWKYL